MASVSNSPTQNPKPLFQKDPNRHYVMVEKDNGDYESPLYDLLSKGSLVDPSKTMYREESEDPKVTGHRRRVLLSCSKEDHEKHLANSIADAKTHKIDPSAKGASDYTRFEDSSGVFES